MCQCTNFIFRCTNFISSRTNFIFAVYELYFKLYKLYFPVYKLYFELYKTLFRTMYKLYLALYKVYFKLYKLYFVVYKLYLEQGAPKALEAKRAVSLIASKSKAKPHGTMLYCDKCGKICSASWIYCCGCGNQLASTACSSQSTAPSSNSSSVIAHAPAPPFQPRPNEASSFGCSSRQAATSSVFSVLPATAVPGNSRPHSFQEFMKDNR